MHFCGSHYLKAEKHSSRQKHSLRAGKEQSLELQEERGGIQGTESVRQKGVFWCNRAVKAGRARVQDARGQLRGGEDFLRGSMTKT